MGVPRTKQSSTLRYSRLLSFISITVTLFMLGALGLVYVLEQGLSHEVRERVAFTIELPSQEQTETSKLTQELRSLPYVRDVELITPDSAARSLAEVLGEDPTKVLGYNPLQPIRSPRPIRYSRRQKVYKSRRANGSLPHVTSRRYVSSCGFSLGYTSWSASYKSTQPQVLSSTLSVCAYVRSRSSVLQQASSLGRSSREQC